MGKPERSTNQLQPSAKVLLSLAQNTKCCFAREIVTFNQKFKCPKEQDVLKSHYKVLNYSETLLNK